MTKVQRKILERLAAGELLEYFQPGGWWIGNRPINAHVCNGLLALIAIRTVDQVGHETYTISDIGRQLLASEAPHGE